MKAAIIIILSFLLSFACYSSFNLKDNHQENLIRARRAEKQLRAEIIKMEQDMMNDMDMTSFLNKAGEVEKAKKTLEQFEVVVENVKNESKRN